MVLVLGVLLVVAGGIWLAQGLDLPFAPGSFMTSDPLWAVIGGATLAVGLAITVCDVRERLSARHPPEDPE